MMHTFKQTSRKRSLLVLLCVFALSLRIGEAFVPQLSHLTASPSRCLASNSAWGSTKLYMAKKVKKGGGKVTVAGGGFGGGSAATKSKNLRSISGKHTGVGSKVLRDAANTYDAIRKEHGVEASVDVYIRSPKNSPTIFWFVGKVAAQDGVSFNDACIAQKRVIFEYSQRELRPQNMGGPYASSLELWFAPGDSEMDVVQNKVTLEKVVGSAADLPDTMDARLSTGYNPEIYIGDERHTGGLRVERDEEGNPINPVFEVNESV